MQHGIPVLAANTGGPLETVIDGKTGWLRDVRDTGAWSDVMKFVANDQHTSEISRMGKSGKRRVDAEFSLLKMSQRLQDEIEQMFKIKREESIEWRDLMLGLGVVGIFVAALLLTMVRGPPDSTPRKKYTKLNP
jgi:alpha-1,3/alpha-1,6-mannosyltransferase